MHERGITTPLLLGIGGVVIILSAILLFLIPASNDSTEMENEIENTVTTQKNIEPQENGLALPSEITLDEEVAPESAVEVEEVPDVEVEAESPVVVPVTSSEEVLFNGTVLAGSVSPLIEFNQADYEKAVNEKKVVALFFYANWCPNCKIEFPRMQAAFDELQSDDVVGFRVNYKDSDTTDTEEGLARAFGVAYQHTKVFLKNGERVSKSPETWDQARYVSEINQLLN